jgi:rubrerythrin
MGMEGEGLSRGEVMLKGALAAAALSGLSAIGPYLQGALAAGGGGDRDTLNFLLPFEYLQEEIYRRGLTEVSYRGDRVSLDPEQKSLIETLLDEERQHIAALTKAIEKLGGKPAAKGDYAFAYRELFVLFRLAAEIEQSAIWAYNGVIPSLESTELKELAGSIVQVEGRHLATLFIQMNLEPAPRAFERGQTEFQSLGSVRKFTGVL